MCRQTFKQNAHYYGVKCGATSWQLPNLPKGIPSSFFPTPLPRFHMGLLNLSNSKNLSVVSKFLNELNFGPSTWANRWVKTWGTGYWKVHEAILESHLSVCPPSFATSFWPAGSAWQCGAQHEGRHTLPQLELRACMQHTRTRIPVPVLSDWAELREVAARPLPQRKWIN